MRKFFITLICTFIALIICLSGCSCNEKQALSFNSAFYNATTKSDPPAGYKETLTYKVNYAEKYSSGISKSEHLNSIGFNFSDGVYVSTLETLTTLPEGIESDIVNDLPNNAKTIYKLTTKLNINCSYSGCASGDGEHKDVVESTVYFCSSSFSYAPIYSELKVDNSLLMFYAENSFVERMVATRTITYNKDSYTLFEKLNDAERITDYEYKFTTIIDNAQLLFVLRNIDIAVDSSFYLPTVSYAYGEAKDLKVDGESQTTVPVEITKNGTLLTDEMSLNNLSFMVNDSKQAGMSQFASVQKSKSEKIAFNSLLYSYAEPLMAYGNMLPMGYLVYTLNSVEITTASNN